MLDARNAGHVRADFRDHGQRNGDVHAVDAREVHAAHPEQLRTQIELGRIASPATLLALGGVTVVSLQALQLQFDFAVAIGQLRAHEVERAQGLLEDQQVLGPPVALQALGRPWLRSSVPRWRYSARSTQTCSVGRKAPLSRP